MPFWGVRRAPIGFAAPLGFKWLDSQPEKSNMDPFSIDFHNCRVFENSCHGCLTRYLSYFRPVGPNFEFRAFRSEPKRCATKSYTDSWWYHLGECLILPVSCPFKISMFRLFFDGPFSCPVSEIRKKCTLIVSVNRVIAGPSLDWRAPTEN